MERILFTTIAILSFLFLNASEVKDTPEKTIVVNLPEIEIVANHPTTDSIIYLTKTILKSVEGLTLTSYWDYKQYTAGYGVRVEGRVPRTVEEAEQDFEEEFEECVQKVEEHYPLLEGAEKYAVVMMVYNCNIYQLRKASNTNAALLRGEKPPFHLWVNVTKYDENGNAYKEVLNGLVRRRAIESALWDDWREYYHSHLELHENKVFHDINKHS
jgi:GH24 family phage-related lysozyme (muramidase)